MITGAHIIIYTRDADADRAFFRDVLGLENIDLGGGWLVFALPPSELAFHPAENNEKHETYLLCEDIETFRAKMTVRGIECSEVREESWGLLTSVRLPGGGRIGVYEPKHERPFEA